MRWSIEELIINLKICHWYRIPAVIWHWMRTGHSEWCAWNTDNYLYTSIYQKIDQFIENEHRSGVNDFLFDDIDDGYSQEWEDKLDLMRRLFKELSDGIVSHKSEAIVREAAMEMLSKYIHCLWD